MDFGLGSESQLQSHETQPLFDAIMSGAPVAEATAAHADALALPLPLPLPELAPIDAPLDHLEAPDENAVAAAVAAAAAAAAEAAEAAAADAAAAEEALRTKLVEVHTSLKQALVRNRDFAHYGRLPHFTKGLTGDGKPFIRVKVADTPDGAVYRLGRVHGYMTCAPYLVVPTSGAHLDFEVSVDCIDKPVRITSISNRSASMEEMTEYIATKALTIDAFAAEVTRAVTFRVALCAERVKDMEEAREVAVRNSTLVPQAHFALQISALQRETTTRFSQVGGSQSEFTQEDGTATPARPSAVDPQVSAMLDIERKFTTYVEQTLDTPSTALMRDLTLRNRSKNNVSTVQAVENFKKYPRTATFSDEGLLWEVDAEKRNLLCAQYDEIKEGTLNADELMPESLRLKAPAPDPRAGMTFVERCVADAIEASQRNQADLSQVDDETFARTPMPLEPVSLVRFSSRSSKKHRSESQPA